MDYLPAIIGALSLCGVIVAVVTVLVRASFRSAKIAELEDDAERLRTRLQDREDELTECHTAKVRLAEKITELADRVRVLSTTVTQAGEIKALQTSVDELKAMVETLIAQGRS